jgi:hypothetical protein
MSVAILPQDLLRAFFMSVTIHSPMPTISVFVIPDGFGDKLFSVACDDPQQEAFRNAHQSALTALSRTVLGMHIQEGSLGRRASRFHPDLIASIRTADGGRNIDRWCFDIASVTSGNLTGLRAIGIGSTRQKRRRACKAAIALAAVYYTLRQMRVAFRGRILPIIFRTILSFLIDGSTLNKLVATSQIINLA